MKIITRYSDFIKNVNESSDNPIAHSESHEAAIKIKKSLLILSVRLPSFGQALARLDIYATRDPNIKTMATNGSSVVFCPSFVLENSIPSLVFVLVHELLHCLNHHHKRVGNRNNKGWNYATDYAINFLIDEIMKTSDYLAWPTMDNKKIGLYDKRFEGMSAEAIYDILIEDGTLDGSGNPTGKPVPVSDGFKSDGNEPGEVIPEDDMPEVDPDGVVQIVEEEKEDKEDKEDKKSKEDKEGKEDKKGKEDKEDKEKNKPSVSVGSEVLLRDGTSAIVKTVYSNGDIEV